MSQDVNINALFCGMTDAELEQACESQITGYTPWAYWTSELYSFGKCLRFMTKYPGFLPLYVYSDHGITLSSNPFPHELESDSRVYFTWSAIKEKRSKEFINKKLYRITHPWIFYRKKNNIKRLKNTRGTLVFYTHSSASIKYKENDVSEYIIQLRELPDKYQPVVLCLHMHDINAGLHKNLRHYGLPIVTAGNTLSINFVDHFYELIRGYSHATSITWGSQVAYCVEFGIPYFYLGTRGVFTNISDKNFSTGVLPEYIDQYHEKEANRAKLLFNTPVDAVTNEQRIFVESLLGVDSKVKPRQIAYILWREFFHNWNQWRSIIRHILIYILRKTKLLKYLKLLRDKCK